MTEHIDTQEIITLVHHAQTGDPAAYGILVGRFQNMAYGYAYAILNDFHMAQDATQEAFIESYQCLPGLHEAWAFPSWLKRKVHKHCDRLIRGNRQVYAPLETAEDFPSPLPGPAELAEQRDLARCVRQAILALPTGQREVTMLFYIGGYSHQEIADFLAISAKTVKSRLYTSRSRLRDRLEEDRLEERMIEMVENELKANALPTGFTRETVDAAVARAGELRKEQHYAEAEELLRQILAEIPKHIGALRELNRTLMYGRVYGQARWDLLSELVAHGKAILLAADDDQARHQLIVTLLAIPAMPEAAALLEEWIARERGTGKRSNLERLGMLAWAKGCMGEFTASDDRWEEMLREVGISAPEEAMNRVPFAAYTLVDCFAASGEIARAQRIARQAWELCRKFGPLLSRQQSPNDEIGWLILFHQARLDMPQTDTGQTEITQIDVVQIAEMMLARHTGVEDPERQATALSLRNWIEDASVTIPVCLEWAKERIAVGAFDTIERFRSNILSGFRARGDWQAADRLAIGIWELLGLSDAPEAVTHRTYWNWEIDNPAGAIATEDWVAAGDIVRRNIARFGIKEGAWWTIMLAARRSMPFPPDIVEAVAQGGIAGIDTYGLWGWYLVAREAAAAGDTPGAFDALHTALSYWSNPPSALLDICVKDARWGALRDDPEFLRIIADKRDRIGPIHGQLHYFPGW